MCLVIRRDIYLGIRCESGHFVGFWEFANSIGLVNLSLKVIQNHRRLCVLQIGSGSYSESQVGLCMEKLVSCQVGEVKSDGGFKLPCKFREILLNVQARPSSSIPNT